MEPCQIVLLLICIVTSLTVVILLISMDTIDPLQVGITINSISKSIGNDTYFSGRYIVGPFTSFIKYPANLVSVEFSDSKMADSGPLTTRTREGLGISLAISYQYQLKNQSITQLYQLANTNYEGTIQRISRDIILKVASNYNAEEYWLNRKAIGDRMKDQLNKGLEGVYASCNQLQLIRIDLPKSYEDSIVQTQVENQLIKKREFEQEATLIRQSISVIRSNASAQIRITNSSAEAEAYKIKQTAESKAINNTINNQANIYGNIQTDIGLKGDDLNEYLYMNTLGEQKNAKLLVGMDNAILSFGNTPVKSR